MTDRDDELTPEALAAALKDMVQTEGWRLFCAKLDQEWGDAGFGREIERKTTAIPAGPNRAHEIAQVVERLQMTKDAVTQLRRWPEEQIRTGAKTSVQGWLEKHRRGAR